MIVVSKDGVRSELGECRLDNDADIALNLAWDLLSAAEYSRALQFRLMRDRDRFVRARGYLRTRLGAWLGKAPKALAIQEARNGKPFVTGERLNFSLSHSGGHAVVALSSRGAVGVDLERSNRDDGLLTDLNDLLRTCLTSDERQAIEALPATERLRRFLVFWTAKEARMKLTGEGMALPPNAISLNLVAGMPVGYLRPLSPAAHLRFVGLSLSDAVCCLATEAQRESPMNGL